MVVIGILIALQINNWNEGKKERAKEIGYLYNLKADLHYEIKNNGHYLYDIHVVNISALDLFGMNNPKYGIQDRLTVDDIPESKHVKLIEDAQWQYNNQTFNNGIKLALMNNSHLAQLHKNIVVHIQNLLIPIDEDINI